jgi:tyrosyl-tRNA synthetase
MKNDKETQAKIQEILTRGVHDVFTKDELQKKLESGKPLIVKLGTDVTGSDLHLGHAVLHRKIRDFQELGHNVVLIIGDYTTMVGDHSDKVDMRAERTQKDIVKDAAGFTEQFFKTVHKKGVKVVPNSTWLSKLTFADAILLMKEFTVSQLLDRETFLLRYKGGKPIGLDEFLYPLMQGYDSVAIKADVELGGTDQTFNLLAGRYLTEKFLKKPQSAIAMKLLLGSDGRPMGKSLGNYISLRATANDMYGKLMSIVDGVIFDYFELLTRVSFEEIGKMRHEVAQGANPMLFKKKLAHEIVSFYHGVDAANSAQLAFEQTFAKGEIPKDAKSVTVNIKMPLVDILIKNGMVASKSEFRRLVQEGAITFHGEIEEKKIIDPASLVDQSGALKIGKRRFLKITVKKDPK